MMHRSLARTLAIALLLGVSSTALASPNAVGGVDHVGLTVRDLDASMSFFTSGLGFEIRGRDDHYPAVFLRNGETTVTLWRASHPDRAVAFDRKNNVGLHHLALRVDSFEALDALHEKLKAIPGVRIEFAPELSYGGPAKHMMVREPSGNRLEFIHRPPKSAP